jgi:uncharacterized membrane protein HdeD (DUF308 family)
MSTQNELIDRGEAAPSWGWWLLMLVGVVSVVAGGILVAKPSHSLATLAVVFGIFLLIDGIIDLISSFSHAEENRALAAIVGLLAIVIGILLIRHPTSAVSAIGLIIGIWLVAAGVMRLLRAFTGGGHVVLRALIALLEIVVGVIIVSDPHIGYATLAILIGIWLIINGLAWIGLGIAVRAAR